MALGAGIADPVGSAALLRFIRRGRSFSGHEPHCFFLNTGTGRFADLSAASSLDLLDDGRAVGRVDWDLDGDLDLWVTNRNGPQLRFLRNALPDVNHFLAVRLQGTVCNRDAIGARVEVIRTGDEGRRLVKSLCAGDGYLAQSSKWIHFGLGGDTQIQRLVVRWPGGASEEFVGLQADQRYFLVQGTGKAKVWKPAHEQMQWHDTRLPVSAPSKTIELLSVSRVPVPRLPYQTFGRQRDEVHNPASGQVVLLNLWASWCQPCLAELAELTRHESKITEAGLEVVALSVDGIDGVEADSSRSPERVLERIGFPFRSGVADAGLVEKLQLLHDHLFDLHLPLPVPTSVLIDGQGRLVAWYEGRVAVERILRDVATVDLDVQARRQQSVPFSGRWYEPLSSMPLVPLLDALTSGGFLYEADEYVRRLGTVRKEYLVPAIVRLGMAFYRKGAAEKAQEHFRVAVKIDPTFPGVETSLGSQRELEGRPASAAALYRAALRRNPDSVEALNNLAWLLSTHADDAIRNGSQAVELAQQAAQLTDFADPRILDTLAAAHAEAGQFEFAAKVARQALELSRSQGRLSLANKIEQRLQLFTDQKPFRATRNSA